LFDAVSGYSPEQGDVWDRLQDARKDFETVSNRGSEPDIIVRTDKAIFFVEAKLTSGNILHDVTPLLYFDPLFLRQRGTSLASLDFNRHHLLWISINSHGIQARLKVNDQKPIPINTEGDIG
jgi:hypothetical protein